MSPHRPAISQASHTTLSGISNRILSVKIRHQLLSVHLLFKGSPVPKWRYAKVTCSHHPVGMLPAKLPIQALCAQEEDGGRAAREEAKLSVLLGPVPQHHV